MDDSKEKADHPHSVAVGRPFQEKFGPCRSAQYRLIEQGEVESFLLGGGRGRRFIIVETWLDYVKRQQRREAALRAQNGGRLGPEGIARAAHGRGPPGKRNPRGGYAKALAVNTSNKGKAANSTSHTARQARRRR